MARTRRRHADFGLFNSIHQTIGAACRNLHRAGTHIHVHCLPNQRVPLSHSENSAYPSIVQSLNALNARSLGVCARGQSQANSVIEQVRKGEYYSFCYHHRLEATKEKVGHIGAFSTGQRLPVSE